VHGQQDEPFLVNFESRHRRFIRQVALQDPLLHQAAALVLIRAQRLDHGLGVGVDALQLHLRGDDMIVPEPEVPTKYLPNQSDPE
jgi:hypothetical protein